MVTLDQVSDVFARVKETLKRILATPWVTIAKYLFVLIITFVAYGTVNDPISLAMAIIEIGICFLLCNEIAAYKRILASIISSVILLLISIQQLLLIFSNTFVTLVMLTNLDSLEDISGKGSVYIAAAIAMVIFVLLPQNHIKIPMPDILDYVGGSRSIIGIFCVWEILLLVMNGAGSSPLFAYADLAFEQAEVMAAEDEIKSQPNTTLEFYRPDITSYREKPERLVAKPNVVLIFTEGLSQNIVNDPRGIMNNVASWQEKSLSFRNYFNHTFATYRGITGQLFSGYQHNNYDENTLVSLPMIFSDQGYKTCFLNVEGYNKEFSDYLNGLGFDEVIDLHDSQKRGPIGDGYSDKLAYEELYNQMAKRNKEKEPFFLSIYTFGTHASFDSANEKFGDGSDSEINKFYDADYQFGQFMQKFTSDASLVENTIIVFTTDHCTYADMYFTQSFPEWKREHMELDPVPLFIYHKGVRPEVIDVKGRNTLGLAPTVCDYLDITCENYFLGNSLFSPIEAASGFETYFSDGTMSSMRSKNSVIEKASGEEGEKLKLGMWDYYAAKHQEPLTPKDVDEETLKALSEKNAGGDVAQTEKTETDVEKAEATKAQAAQPATADQRK